MAGGDINLKLKLDRQALDFFRNEAPERLKEARKRAVEAMGMVWADESKSITREEDHIDTSLYINSIGYSTGSPSQPIHELDEGSTKTILKTGADVEYAKSLERRYAIMARGLDRSEARMKRVAETQIKNTLGL